MLLAPDEVERRRTRAGVKRAYVDPILAGRPRAYAQFLRRLAAAGMVGFRVRRPEDEATVGFFFRRKA